MQKCDYLSTYFYRLEIIRFYRKDPQTLFQDHFCPKTENQKKLFFLTKIMGQPLSKIWKNETICGAYVYNLQTIPFFPKDPQTLFQDSFSPKTENEKNAIFDQNHGLTPFGK